MLQTIAVTEGIKPGMKLKKLTLDRETIKNLTQEGLRKDAGDNWRNANCSDPFFGCSQVYC